MNRFAKPLALFALALTIVPAAVVFVQGVAAPQQTVQLPEVSSDNAGATPRNLMSDSLLKSLMLAGTLLWFAAAPSWLREDD